MTRRSTMKNSKNTAKLLDLPYAPEADALLDELERSGQFRVGLEAEVEEADTESASNDYAWGRGSGNVSIQDWWTTGRVALRVGPGIAPADLSVSRLNESLVLRTQDGLDRARAGLLAAGGAEWVSAGADRYRESLDHAVADVARGTVALGRARWAVLRHLEAAQAARDEAARERAAWLITLPTFPYGGSPVVTPAVLGPAVYGPAVPGGS